jgi:formylglycine-generating enzyme required for sulfatase activity
LGIVRGIDSLLARIAGPDNALLHNYFRVIFLAVTFVGAPVAIRFVAPLVEARWAHYRDREQQDELRMAQQAWADALARSDEATLSVHAAEGLQAARSAAEAAAELAINGSAAQAVVGFRDALDKLTHAETIAVESLALQLQGALAVGDVESAQPLLASIKRLRANEPGISGWEEQLAELAGASPGPTGIASKPPGPPIASDILTNSLGMKLVPIRAGTFSMGSKEANADRDEQPQHQVRISQDFYLGMYEVTQAEYRTVTGWSPSKFVGDDLPAEQLTAADADLFCRQLTERENKTGKLPAGMVYRLPTEAQWEYAARAGASTAWPFGDDSKQLNEHGWSALNGNVRTHPVGLLKPNAWQLYDMLGNVREIVLDSYSETAYAQRAAVTFDPLVQNAKSPTRTIRGGSWGDSAMDCRPAGRMSGGSAADQFTGLRVALVKSTGTDLATGAPAPAKSQETFESSIGMKLVRIKAGEFVMGSNDGEVNERPAHRVAISQDFYLGIYEVTQVEYRAVDGNSFDPSGGSKLPMSGTSTDDAESFCRKLTAKDRAAGKLTAGMEYRLPTEAQWEYAARAGSTSKWYFGDDRNELDKHAWFQLNSDGNAHEVGQKLPNAWGLYDMAGNVWEWVADDYRANVYVSQSVGFGGRPVALVKDPLYRDPPGSPDSGYYRVLRGGSYQVSHDSTQSAFRGSNVARGETVGQGFRVALVWDSAPSPPNGFQASGPLPPNFGPSPGPPGFNPVGPGLPAFNPAGPGPPGFNPLGPGSSPFGPFGPRVPGNPEPGSTAESVKSAGKEPAVPIPDLPPRLGKVDRDAAEAYTEGSSGFKYRILRKGSNKMAADGDTVKVNIEFGTLVYKGEKAFWQGNGRQLKFKVGEDSRQAAYSEAVQLIGRRGLIEILPKPDTLSGKAAKALRNSHILLELVDVD